MVLTAHPSVGLNLYTMFQLRPLGVLRARGRERKHLRPCLRLQCQPRAAVLQWMKRKKAYSFTIVRLGRSPNFFLVPNRTDLQRQAQAAHKFEETHCGHPPGFMNPPEVPCSEGTCLQLKVCHDCNSGHKLLDFSCTLLLFVEKKKLATWLRTCKSLG